jgi:hypothetical protein
MSDKLESTGQPAALERVGVPTTQESGQGESVKIELKETQHFWIITHGRDSMQHLYDKEQYTAEQAIFDQLFLVRVMSALCYALEQEKNPTTKRLIIQEFWCSLNRKALIPNESVDTLIDWTGGR